jgi:glycosyltransferase involved in cell wall biosynthesis
MQPRDQSLPPLPSRLDGKTILRFAHAYEAGGGTERYLEDLDQALLERHALTVLRLHLTRKETPPAPSVEEIGRGRLIRVPLAIVTQSESGSSDDTSLWRKAKARARGWIVGTTLFWRVLEAAGSPPKAELKPGQAIGAGLTARQLFKTHCVDLVVMHYFGGADADEIISAAQNYKVPVALLNHFSNDLFLHLSVRKHAQKANGIAGVNGRMLPRYVRQRFVNLADGIDLKFFNPTAARTSRFSESVPIVLLPARVIREKGQWDLVKSAARLRDKGLAFKLVFAGRVDSSGFVAALKAEITRLSLGERVNFTGPLGVDELRDLYAASALVALPTYHHEGLPRIVLEAQAMHLPVIAYNQGGVADGVADRQSGFVLAPGDISGLTRCLALLIEDTGLRRQYGEAGRQKVESQFSVQALAKRHEAFYESLLSREHR